MLRRPVFWIAFVALSLAAAIFTFENFSTAFPLVSIDLKMNRADALREARSLVERNGWPSKEFDEAVDFSADQEVQNFIELEGGGKPELARIIKEKIFAPYTWRVRRFREGDAHETLVRFTPEGVPYGFRVKLPNEEKGASKPVEEGRRIAEETAANEWKIDFSRYQPVESSKEDRPGGRTDHAFVYERQDERVREGRFRLRLVVGGDKLTELTHFVQIPEAFTRRYEQMRSANEAINAAASVAVFGLYILGFCGIGLFFMIRQHWVLWRQPAFWGIFIAALMGLQQLNSWPLVWMGYDTALPASGFAIRQIMGAIAIFGGFSVLLTVSFMAAETLSRRAFPEHVQLWKVWSGPVASSRTIFGQTAAGYLLVAPFFAYEIVLYFFAQEKLGWWTPSDTLVNPDMFANYVPSLSAIAQAAQAGFWEECLFRAVPLATAALIGDKFRKRGVFIGVAMILQALVFASGHAGYANQPAYARVVELIIPSFAFGTLYLVFGLLPGIVLHFAYDTVWMALPLFVSSGARAHVEQAIVAAAVLVPLWVILRNRARAGSWKEVPVEALNGAWRPQPVPEAPPAEPLPAAQPTRMPAYVTRSLPLAGVVGLVIWAIASPFRTDAPPLKVGRAEAERTAREAFSRQGDEFDSSWTVLSHVEGQPGEINRFVWQTSGRDWYRQNLGRFPYITPPSWVVRFARFQGDVAERAEEFQAFIDGNGRDFRLSHQLPEARPGKSLPETEARALALAAVPLLKVREVSAQAEKRPARTDWAFVFKDQQTYGLAQGEPRISIDIAGAEIVDKAQYVYVPEEWSRQERARRNVPNILSIVCTIVIVAIAVTGAIVGAVHWSRRRAFSAKTFSAIAGVVFLLGAVNVVNSWPVLASQSSTAQPLQLQIGIGIATSLLFGIFTSAGLGLIAGLVAGKIRIGDRYPNRKSVLAGISVALVLAGVGALARLAAPEMSPNWGNLAPASMLVPFLGAALSPIGGYFTQTLILLTILYALSNRHRGDLVWIAVGLALAGSGSIETMASWLITGLTTGILLLLAYRLVFRHQPELLLISTATLSVLSSIRDGVQHMYPAAVPGALAGAAIVAVAAWIWFRGSMESEAA
jgi:hypothetical protein